MDSVESWLEEQQLVLEELKKDINKWKNEIQKDAKIWHDEILKGINGWKDQVIEDIDRIKEEMKDGYKRPTGESSSPTDILGENAKHEKD